MKFKKIIILGIFILSFLITGFLYPLIDNVSNNSSSITNKEVNSDPIEILEKNLTHTSDIGLISDDGNDLFSIMQENISDTIHFTVPDDEIENQKIYNLDINSSHWNITRTNLTFSNLDAKNVTLVIEDYPEEVIDNAGTISLGYYRLGAMSFKISTTCRLKNISMFIQEAVGADTWNISIYNASRSLGKGFLLAPRSSTGISVEKTVTTTPQAHWETFNFNDEILNLTNTFVDNDGFAYYFVVARFPMMTLTDYRAWYFEIDDIPIDDGFAYQGFASSLGIYRYTYLEGDLCLKLNLAPNSSTPTTEEVGLSLKNPQPLVYENITQLDSYSQRILDVWNSSVYLHYFASQNFTLTDVGKVENISLYVNQTGNFTDPITLIIMNSNSTNTGPELGDNSLEFLQNVVASSKPWVIEPGTSFEGWYNFSFPDTPYFEKNKTYWWLLSASTNVSGNITIFGEPTFGSTSLYSLNITLDITGGSWKHYTTSMDYNFSCKLQVRYGYEYFDLDSYWYNESLYIPNTEGTYTFSIKSKWYGDLYFDTNYFCKIENLSYFAKTIFLGTDSSSIIQWNITCDVILPLSSADNLNLLNISIPNWNVTYIYNGSSYANYTNWRIDQIDQKRFLIINNVSSNLWKIICNSSNVNSFLTVEKKGNIDFSVVENATIYDYIRINMSLPNQDNGVAYLSGLYPFPNNFTTFTLQNSTILPNTSFYWRPSNYPLAIGGIYNFFAYWTNGTETSICTIDFLLLPNPTNLTILLNVTKNPYVNDTTQTITVFYNESSRNFNITGATINASLNGINQDWEDLYLKTGLDTDKGKYRIKLDTKGFSEGSYQLKIIASKDGYNTAEIDNILIFVEPVPTTIQSTIDNIVQYERATIGLTISFKDTFHNKDIDWGSVSFNIMINATFNLTGNMTLSIPSESIYSNSTISLLDIPSRETPYIINITAEATNCETSYYAINLTILNKTTPSLIIYEPSVKSRTALVLNPFSLTNFYEGDVLLITVRLTNTSSGLGLGGKTIKFEFSGGISDIYAITNDEGYAIIEITVPSNLNSFSFRVIFGEIMEIANGESNSFSYTVTSTSQLMVWNLTFIGIIVAIAVALSFTFYTIRKRSRNRKLEVHKKELMKIKNRYENIAALLALLVIEKESGNCVYNQQFQMELNADLISGFLTAISAFQTEIRKDKDPNETMGFELKYADYNILMVDREFSRIALILDKAPDEDLRNTINTFADKFGERFNEHLKQFDGNLQPFKKALPLIQEHLRLSLLYPHHLSSSAIEFIKNDRFPNNLTTLDKTLIKLAETIMRTNNVSYFFLPQLIQMGAAGLESNLEVFGSLDKILDLKFFIPFET
ncbi:MAG: hypothetical protein EAX96_15745 [Candidatus Lokiarchaeota archaeon]|nr:hypothetical protein [Candidatus Lokiarchaeota archaeon]